MSSTDEWIEMMDGYMYIRTHTHTHWNTTQLLKKKKEEEILPITATWMDLKEGIVLSEINQTDKDEYYTISLISRI